MHAVHPRTPSSNLKQLTSVYVISMLCNKIYLFCVRSGVRYHELISSPIPYIPLLVLLGRLIDLSLGMDMIVDFTSPLGDIALCIIDDYDHDYEDLSDYMVFVP